uniref:Uncharacterized protein n=1 Tax=Cannabis sativa TaxID=3483 RepID=A0A803PBQ9_CANSA
MVVTRLTSVERSIIAGQPTGGTPVTGAGNMTTPASQMPGGGLIISSTTRPLRPANVGIKTSDQIPLEEPRVELEDPKEADPLVEQLSHIVASLEQ